MDACCVCVSLSLPHSLTDEMKNRPFGASRSDDGWMDGWMDGWQRCWRGTRHAYIHPIDTVKSYAEYRFS